ncbi:unnamed protein product [Effrenium voratum]|nr:unnamed protein product [Effrenium voratum]
MRKTKSKSPGRPKKSASLPVLKKTYVAPLQLCSVNIAKHSFSFRDVRKGMVQKPSKRRLPFMSAERGIEWELAAATKLPPPKLPSLRKVMSSIHSMNLSMEMSQTISKGSLRSNPAFGGSGPLEEGPKLPMKHSTRRMQGLMQQKTPKLARSNPPAKRGKKQNWAGAETELVEYNEPEESHLEEAPGIPDSDSSLSSSSGSSSDSDWGDDSSEEDKPPPTYLTRGRSSGMTRRMSAFAMMLPLLDSNNEPKRRGSVAEVFLKTLEDDEDKKDDELDFPWSDEECRSVFIKFDTDTDGEVATEELELMLKYMGCILRPGEVERLIHDMFSYATVSWEEWNTFLERYREVDERYLRAEFAAADSDKNGVLDVDELHTLLAKMGYVTDAHTVMEAMETIGCKQTVNLRKFEKLREHLRCTEGLAKDDVTQLRELYDRVAATAKMQQRARKVDLGVGSHSDIAKRLIAEQQEMPVEDVQRVITFLGYSVSTDRVDQITREVDNDLSRFISFQELLKLIRRVRDVERESIAAMFEALAGDGDLPLQDLPRGLTELRYYPTDDMVFHVLDELGPRSKTHINQGEVFAFLCLFREKEGLTPEERREMRQVFEHQCKITAQRAYVQQLEDPTGNTKMTNNGSPKLQPAASPRPTNPRGSTLVGPSPKAATTPSPRNLLAAIDTLVVEQELDALRMNRVMRWFGFEKPLMQVQDMMASIDLDAKGKLSFEELLGKNGN